MTAYEVSFLGNYLIHQSLQLDTAIIRKIVSLARLNVNRHFSNYIEFTAAIAYYNQGLTRVAFSLVRRLARQEENEKY